MSVRRQVWSKKCARLRFLIKKKRRLTESVIREWARVEKGLLRLPMEFQLINISFHRIYARFWFLSCIYLVCDNHCDYFFWNSIISHFWLTITNQLLLCSIWNIWMRFRQLFYVQFFSKIYFHVFHFQYSLASLIMPPIESVEYWPQVTLQRSQSTL